MKKTVVGCLETVEIEGKKFRARIDTGAKMSSLDRKIFKKFNLGKTIRKAKIKSSHGVSLRPVIRASVKIKDRKIKASFNLADRSQMKYRVLIGRNILRNDFLIDVTK